VFGGGLHEMMLRLDALGKREDEMFLDEGFWVNPFG